MNMLELSGELVRMGDMQAEEVIDVAGLPRIEIMREDGSLIYVIGLTRDEVRACGAAFFRRVTVAIDMPKDGA